MRGVHAYATISFDCIIAFEPHGITVSTSYTFFYFRACTPRPLEALLALAPSRTVLSLSTSLYCTIQKRFSTVWLTTVACQPSGTRLPFSLSLSLSLFIYLQFNCLFVLDSFSSLLSSLSLASFSWLFVFLSTTIYCDKNFGTSKCNSLTNNQIYIRSFEKIEDRKKLRLIFI